MIRIMQINPMVLMNTHRILLRGLWKEIERVGNHFAYVFRAHCYVLPLTILTIRQSKMTPTTTGENQNDENIDNYEDNGNNTETENNDDESDVVTTTTTITMTTVTTAKIYSQR